MAILLDSSGRMVLRNGSVRVGDSGDGCCCYIEATPCTTGSPRVWVAISAIEPLPGDSRMWFYYSPASAFYSVADTDPQSTPGANKVTTTPSDRRHGCPAITAYATGEVRTFSSPCWTDEKWFFDGGNAITSRNGGEPDAPPAQAAITVSCGPTSNHNLPSGYYTFTTTVNLNAYVNLSLVRLYFRVMFADNAFVSVKVNGTAASVYPTALVGLVTGDNTIEAVLRNGDAAMAAGRFFPAMDYTSYPNDGGPMGLGVSWTVGML